MWRPSVTQNNGIPFEWKASLCFNITSILVSFRYRLKLYIIQSTVRNIQSTYFQRVFLDFAYINSFLMKNSSQKT